MKRALPALLIAALVLPTVIWIFIDQRPWPWDPAYYGYWTLQAVEAMHRGLSDWIDVNLHSLRLMPPLITWLGQFFVPLRHLTGGVESALMLQIVLMVVGTLFVVYRTARSFGSEGAGLAAITVCGGASLFIGLSHHFLTEPSQCLAAALSVAVAWRVERRSAMRNAGYVALMVAFALLSKAPSLVFVLPALTYIAVALVVTRRDARLPATKADTGLLAAGVAALALTAAWYAANWDFVVTHFVQASVGAEVQSYWSTGTFATKLKFWIISLADALTLTWVTPLLLSLAIVTALVISISRVRKESSPVHAAVTGGTLFGLYLVGTVVAVVIAYALQINEDTRFIVALIPIIAVLTAWMLVVVKRALLTCVVTAAFLANAVLVQATSFGVEMPKRHDWVYVVERSPADRETLSGLVAATCLEGETHAIGLGISYPYVNGNAANFTAGKRRLRINAGCVYHVLPQDSLEKAQAYMEEQKIRYVVIVPPAQQDPEFFVNPLAKALAEYVAASPDFEFMESVGRYHIYRRLMPDG